MDFITTSCNGFTYLVLNDEMSNFITTYKPADRHFTSAEEVALIERELHLSEVSDQKLISSLRNSIVTILGKIIEVSRESGDELWWDQYLPAMCSLTAVIDNYMYR